MAESNRIINLLTPFISQVQLIENMLDDLRTKRRLTSANNSQLDGFGDVIGLAREMGMSDDDYKAALNRQILLNQSCGQPEMLITFMNALLVNPFRIKEIPVSALRVNVSEIVSPWAKLIHGLNKLKPLAVRIEVISQTGDDDSMFGFADEDGHTSRGAGLAEKDCGNSGYVPATSSGHLTEKITNY